MKYAMDPSPDEDELTGLRKQTKEQDVTIRQLRDRIAQLEEVEGMNRELAEINMKLLEEIKDLRKDAGMPT